MSVKLSVGLQKMIGLADFGSLGASCQVEFEIDGSLLEHDGDGFQRKVAEAFAACQQAVQEQLARNSAPALPSSSKGTSDAALLSGGKEQPGSGPRPTETPQAAANRHNTSPETGTATASQIRAIFGIARKRGVDPLKLVRDRFGVDRPDALSLRQASALIDELKRSAAEQPS